MPSVPNAALLAFFFKKKEPDKKTPCCGRRLSCKENTDRML